MEHAKVKRKQIVTNIAIWSLLATCVAGKDDVALFDSLPYNKIIDKDSKMIVDYDDDFIRVTLLQKQGVSISSKIFKHNVLDKNKIMILNNDNLIWIRLGENRFKLLEILVDRTRSFDQDTIPERFEIPEIFTPKIEK